MDGREAGGEWSIKNQFSAVAATESNAKLHATLQKFDAKPKTKTVADAKPVYDPIASGRKVSHCRYPPSGCQAAVQGPAAWYATCQRFSCIDAG